MPSKQKTVPLQTMHFLEEQVNPRLLCPREADPSRGELQTPVLLFFLLLLPSLLSLYDRHRRCPVRVLGHRLGAVPLGHAALENM